MLCNIFARSFINLKSWFVNNIHGLALFTICWFILCVIIQFQHENGSHWLKVQGSHSFIIFFMHWYLFYKILDYKHVDHIYWLIYICYFERVLEMFCCEYQGAFWCMDVCDQYCHWCNLSISMFCMNFIDWCLITWYQLNI